MPVYYSPPVNFVSQVEVAGCLCQHESTFLLLKRNSLSPQGGTWGVPAGKLELGERPEAGAIREAKEETGLCIGQDKLVHMLTLYVQESMDYIFHLYACSFDSLPAVALNGEHTEYRWVTFEEAYELPLIHGGKALLEYVYSKVHR